MRIRMGVVAFLIAILCSGAVPPAGGAVAAGDDDAGVASDTEAEAQQRVQERRRERDDQRQWISVPELSPSEALPLVGAPGVVIIDVTCREGGADITDRIPGAVWRDCTKVEQWAHNYEEAKTILVYCA